ncbi:MAG: hypothetical protein IPP26_02085 [Flavobacteriales bacterium]|nr:hypothetical protein [Flavobacteriales bacterium]
MKNTMLLRNALLAGLLLGPVLFTEAQIAINNTATAPNPSAILDLSDLTRGLLAPRMLRAERLAIAAPANSLLVYQTDDINAGLATNELKGFWYRDGAAWVRIGSTATAWQLGGNAGTNPATNYMGTSDAQDLSFRGNTTEGARLMGAAGANQGFFNVGQPVGTNPIAPQERMEVNGAMRLNGTTATANAGDIRFDASKGVHEGYTDNALAYPASGWYQLENVFGSRPKETYSSTATVTCQYPSLGPAPPNSNVLALPRPWPIIDDPTFPNISSFGTLETPYSTFWEDGRHQFLYRAADMATLNICPLTDITAIAFQCPAGGGQQFRNAKVNMKNTLSASQATLDLAGLVPFGDYAATPFTPVAGWNIHQWNVANPPYQWQLGFNMLVEFCFDNQDWTSNVAVNSENTTYLANYSLYCDACGGPGGPCFYTGPCNANNAIPPPGPGSGGTLCVGWGFGGLAGGGCAWTTTTPLQTCDGTVQFNGAQGAFSKRPLLAMFAQNTAGAPTLPRADYIVAQQGVMIGAAAWATSGAFPNQKFKGPGTISAEKGVFGGGLLLSDHVFDSYYTGAVSPADVAKGKYYAHMPIREMANYVEQKRHLPTMDGREAWQTTGAFSVDKVTSQMWVTVEAQALYIKELNERMEALQKFLVEKRLNELKKK